MKRFRILWPGLSAPVLIAAAIIVVIVAAIAIVAAFRDEGSSTDAVAATATQPPRTPSLPTPTPLPDAWLGRIEGLPPGAQPKLISCRDVNTDGRIDRADASPVDVTLLPGQACVDPAHHADFYADPVRMIRDCENAPPFLLVVAIASAGSDLLQPREGESLGLIDVLNGLQQRATAAGVDMDVIVSTAAIFGAYQPQTSMERWITNEVRQRMDANPCLRVALIGHSHGGVTVTTVAAALDATYGDRILAVAIDRTIALYDRPAEELPARARILNIFQLNEGWHGVAIDAPNVTNVDESDEVAPIAPSDGGGADALVSHKTLDDAKAVQSRIIEDVATFATAP